MKNKKLLSIYLLIILVMNLSSCQTLNIINSNKEYIEETIKFLCSDKCDGRLPGSDGNKEAERYIENCFRDIGLDKYNGSYLHPYQHKLWRVTKKSYNITFNFISGETYNCKYGDDFHLNSLINTDIKAPVTTNVNDRNIENSIVVISDSNETINVINKAKAVLVKSPRFNLNIISKSQMNVPNIQITPQLYDLLKKNEGSIGEIKFDVQASEEEISQNNVIGVIPGENHNNAIVVTSHYDHVGRVANILCRGCIDNATGTAAMIDIAQRIKKYSKNHKLEQDIIFCAFNGEEPYRQGSQAFTKSIIGKYENLYNINIDCVGVKEGKELVIHGDDNASKALCDGVKEYFIKNKVGTRIGYSEFSSDHTSFLDKDIPSVAIIQEGYSKVVHTIDDTIDKANFKYIDKVGKVVSDFIVSNPSTKFTVKNTLKNPIIDELQKVVRDEKEKLEFNQYKYIMVGNKKVLVDNCLSGFGDNYKDKDKEKNGLNKLKSLYPDLYAIKDTEEYALRHIEVFDDSKEYVKNPEINKVYYKKNVPVNIRRLDFQYQKGKYKTNGFNEINISLTRERKNDEIYNKDYTFKVELERNYEYSIDEKETKIGNELYHIMYGKNDNTIKGLYKCIKCKNEIFHVTISSINSEWGYKTVDETIKAYNDLKLKDIIYKNVNYIRAK